MIQTIMKICRDVRQRWRSVEMIKTLMEIHREIQTVMEINQDDIDSDVGDPSR